MICIMECMHTPDESRMTGTCTAKYDREKLTKIREKIEQVFGTPSTWDDVMIAERYDITGDGDLIMILK